MIRECMICREIKYVGDIYLIKNEYDKKIGYVHKKCLMGVRAKKSMEKEKMILTLEDIKNIDNFHHVVSYPDKSHSYDLFDREQFKDFFTDFLILYKSGKVCFIFDKKEHVIGESKDPFTDEEWEHLKSKVQKIRDKNKNNDNIKKDFKSFMYEHSTIKTFMDGVAEDFKLMNEGK